MSLSTNSLIMRASDLNHRCGITASYEQRTPPQREAQILLQKPYKTCNFCTADRRFITHKVEFPINLSWWERVHIPITKAASAASVIGNADQSSGDSQRALRNIPRSVGVGKKRCSRPTHHNVWGARSNCVQHTHTRSFVQLGQLHFAAALIRARSGTAGVHYRAIFFAESRICHGIIVTEFVMNTRS
jgi:hypothetical protein